MSVSGDIVLVFLGGKRITNVETLGAVAIKTWTVPTGKRWLVLGGYAERDQNATLDMWATDSGDKIIWSKDQVAAGVTNIGWLVDGILIIDAGDKFVYTWGAAQTTPEISLLVLEVGI